MSKRRSSIKRQSRYSSAILNSNWDSFDDEHSRWWKNLEDNSLTRPSTNSNVLNQTSRYLNSDSQMETSSSMDDWWKVLETSNFSKINNHVVERDSLRNVPTSDSEEGSVVKKRKHPVLLKEKKSRDNIFLRALDDSASSTLEVAEKTRRRRSSASTGKTSPNAQHSNRVEEQSLDHSQSTNDILKSRPDIFGRDYKSRNKNAFVDVLKESELGSPLKRKSKTIASDNEQQIERNDSVLVASKASTSNKAVANQPELTSESETDVSLNLVTHSHQIETPKAQSTIFENNSTKSSESNGSSTDSEYDVILKPKSRLLADYRKSIDKNPFENILDNQEDTAKVQENSLHASTLPLRSPSKERVSTGSAQLMPMVVGTPTSQSINISKRQRSIRHFLRSDKMLPVSQVFRDKDKVDGIRRELERLKERETARMKMNDDRQKNEKKSSPEARKIGESEDGRKPQKRRSTRQIHKAFLVNGKPYRPPRLPRPQYWITDRLYKYLWKCMEPRFKLETRVASEKFVHQLSNVTTWIVKRKSYLNYRAELHALMKEMARLGIIRTRNDFYNFCHDFFPYELRAKTVPMLLPGNKSNIPYDADKLHEPLLAS